MVEGAPHTAKRSNDQLLCIWGAPLPPYINEQGGAAGQGGGAPGGVLLPPGVGLPPFLVGLGLGRGKEWRGRRKGGAAPSPCPIRTRGGGARGPALAASPLFHLGPLRPIKSPGGSDNLPELWYCPNLTRNLSSVQI